MKLKVRITEDECGGVIQIYKYKSPVQKPIKAFIYADDREKLDFWISVLRESGSFDFE